MNRRRFLLGALAAPLVLRQAARAGDEPGRMPIGDMHAHLFFFGPNTPASRPLARTMAAGNATLVAWSLVGDLPWLRRGARGLQQKGTPGRGEPIDWLKAEMARVKEHITAQGLDIVLAPEDVDRALRGAPHVVLAVEGASFLETDVGALRTAYDLGIRHLQLVHYIDNPLADIQTAKPRHGGLSELGKAVVAEANRLGMLIDLAHASEEAVRQTLVLSKVPVVWSHGSVTRTAQPHWSMPATKARQLTFPSAKAIADKGGVVGLWTLRSDVGSTTDAYAARLAQMADWLGEDHAGFGTDMNAISNPPIKSYADLQRVVGRWRRQGMPEDTHRQAGDRQLCTRAQAGARGPVGLGRSSAKAPLASRHRCPRVCEKKNQGAGRVGPFTLVRDWMRPSPPHVGTWAVRHHSPGCIPRPGASPRFSRSMRSIAAQARQVDTGAASWLPPGVPARSAQVRQRTSAPLAVGTGGRSVRACGEPGIRRCGDGRRSREGACPQAEDVPTLLHHVFAEPYSKVIRYGADMNRDLPNISALGQMARHERGRAGRPARHHRDAPAAQGPQSARDYVDCLHRGVGVRDPGRRDLVDGGDDGDLDGVGPGSKRTLLCMSGQSCAPVCAAAGSSAPTCTTSIRAGRDSVT